MHSSVDERSELSSVVSLRPSSFVGGGPKSDITWLLSVTTLRQLITLVLTIVELYSCRESVEWYLRLTLYERMVLMEW